MAMGAKQATQDPTAMIGAFLVNNSFAYILYDSAVKRSFVSHKFKQLLKQNSQPLKEIYTFEMDNGRTENTMKIYLNCTLTLNDDTIQIILMPMTIGSFDIKVSMD